MRFLHFILSHSIFIALCAAALCFQTNILLHTGSQIEVYLFVFFSTICSYNFYWLLSKYYFSINKDVLQFIKKNISFISAFGISFLAVCYFLFQLPHLVKYVAVALLLTLLYSLPLWPVAFAKKLQRWGFFKTILLSATWAYITTVIPAVGIFRQDFVAVLLLFTARFFFMFLLCIIFDRRDIAVDKMNGLHSIATDISATKLSLMANAVFVSYLIIGLALRFYFKDEPQMFSFLITCGIVWYVYRLSFKTRGYLFYYFLVDGLMLIAGLISFLGTVF